MKIFHERSIDVENPVNHIHFKFGVYFSTHFLSIGCICVTPLTPLPFSTDPGLIQFHRLGQIILYHTEENKLSWL